MEIILLDIFEFVGSKKKKDYFTTISIERDNELNHER